MKQPKYPYHAPAIRVDQRIGSFFVTVLPANLLLEVADAHQLEAMKVDTPRASGLRFRLIGTQRERKEDRIREISQYINRVDSVFPNSIIIAANRQSLGEEPEETDNEFDVTDERFWAINPIGEKGVADNRYTLTIPNQNKCASIIDGQHRLFSFLYADEAARVETNLLCSVFFDLPVPLQAQIFATINSTQKRVDRSLTYELFGYNLDDEAADYWTPEKLAVYFSRRLAFNEDSPMFGKIALAPKGDKALGEITKLGMWRVSTAVIVDGIMRLFTTNAKKDSDVMRSVHNGRRKLLAKSQRRDSSPLRTEFIETNDLLLFEFITNFLSAANEIFWTNAESGSVITKTIGVQAILDIMRKAAPKALENENFSREFFRDLLRPAGEVDFSLDEYRDHSSAGRAKIRRTIESKIDLSVKSDRSDAI